MYYEIMSCYDNGNLEKALTQAARFVERVGDGRIYIIVARIDDSGGWWIDIVYTKED